MKLLDEVAYACASRYAGHYVVTLSVDQVVFREPINVGELVSIDAAVNYTGRTSMEVGIRVSTQDIHARTSRHTNSCYFTMVALDDTGRPVPVPPRIPITILGRRRPPNTDASYVPRCNSEWISFAAHPDRPTTSHRHEGARYPELTFSDSLGRRDRSGAAPRSSQRKRPQILR